MKAASGVRPSVSAAERHKYQMMLVLHCRFFFILLENQFHLAAQSVLVAGNSRCCSMMM
jgi:hypothetical protein